MMSTLEGFTDDEVPIATPEVDPVRAFFREWADELRRSAG